MFLGRELHSLLKQHWPIVGMKGKERNFIYVSSRSSAGALIENTVNWNRRLTQIKSDAGFWGEGKPEYLDKTSRCRAENQQTQPTYDAWSGYRTRTTMVAGECSHHCAIPASHESYKVNDIALSIDSRKSVVLVLLDLSAAFDTVDHFFLLSRLSARFCICGYAMTWLR